MTWSKCAECGLRFNDDRQRSCPKCGGPPGSADMAAATGQSDRPESKSALTREVGPRVYKVLSPIPALLGVGGLIVSVIHPSLSGIAISGMFLVAAWKWWNGEQA